MRRIEAHVFVEDLEAPRLVPEDHHHEERHGRPDGNAAGDGQRRVGGEGVGVDLVELRPVRAAWGAGGAEDPVGELVCDREPGADGGDAASEVDLA